MPKAYQVGDSVIWTDRTRKTIENKETLESGILQYLIEGRWHADSSLPGEPLLEVRAFLNSNIHIRLNQRFALALNVEYGRLKGWLRNAREAVEELAEKDAAQYFAKQYRLGAGNLLALSDSAAA